jgi:hypothetical protein
MTLTTRPVSSVADQQAAAALAGAAIDHTVHRGFLAHDQQGELAGIATYVAPEQGEARGLAVAIRQDQDHRTVYLLALACFQDAAQRGYATMTMDVSPELIDHMLRDFTIEARPSGHREDGSVAGWTVTHELQDAIAQVQRVLATATDAS